MNGELRDPCPGRIRKVQAVGVIALVFCVPIALGGVLPGTRALMVGAMAVLVLVEWVPRTLMGLGPDRWERGWLGVWIVVSSLVLLQLLPLPSPLSGWVGAYPSTFRALTDIPNARLSPMPLATASYWATFSCYWGLAWIVARLSRRDVERLSAALVTLAACEAFYGLFAMVHASESILGVWSRSHYVGDATGTFVNRNHFAGLLALCWPLGTAWLLLLSSDGRPGLPRPLRRGLALSFSLLVGTAIFGSHSRFGLLAAFAGLAVWTALSRGSAVSGETGKRLPKWIYPAIPAAALVGAVWLGSGALIERLIRITQDTDRFIVWSSLLDLPLHTWILGAGAGSFPDVFKTVQPIQLRTSYAYAHSDWLELLLDFGVVGAAGIALAGWAWWRRVRPARFGALQLAALAGLCAIAIHSFVDFDLHVPGSAVAFWAVVGISMNRRLSCRREMVRQPTH